MSDRREAEASRERARGGGFGNEEDRLRGHSLRSALAAAMTIAFAGAAAAQTAPDPARAAIEARYVQLRAAEDARDGAAIASFFTPDFVSLDVDGRAKNGAGIVAEITSMPVNPTRTAKATIVDFRRVDDEIIVRRRLAIHYAESANGANDAHIVDIDMRTTDAWTLAGAEWRLLSMATDAFRYSRNGKELAHQTRQGAAAAQ